MKYFTNQHPYNTLDAYLKSKFNSKVFKISLNGGFTCPNRDGTKGRGGCIFCSESGSGDFAGNPEENLKTQFQTIKKRMHKKWNEGKYIVYFQANSNTYGELETIKNLYEEAISLDKDIVVLAIATRCDCISDEVIEYLGELNKTIPVWVELGLQTIHPKSMKFLNLGYTLEDFETAVKRLRSKNIEVIAHIINGLPFETYEMMLETAKHLNTLDIQGLKIHSLFILKNTILGKYYESKGFKVLEMDEYVKVTAEQIAHLKQDIIIHRVNGDAPATDLIEPQWSRKKFVVMNEIDKYLRNNNLYQGIYLENKKLDL
ncbi:MAG TPA: TIGR01212 family radical SAM protein [Acholeplasmataceae bacterium]|jgi:radical SAM protein (TIGR01212 family)|nr:TIGR01212 family radical SAM protein [Acholeplasmataceae bacterium]